MSNFRRKSALMSTILGMENSDALADKPVTATVENLDEQNPEELSTDDLSFLDDAPEGAEVGEDPEINIEDIVSCADGNGKVRMSSIRALAECAIPDDKDNDEILSSKTADINAPDIEDGIGNEALGGDPSVSKIAPGGEEEKVDEESQEDAIKSITARLDRLASYCERSGHKRLAYRLDVISDKLESL